MSFDLSSITSGTIMRAPRIILLGVPKIGKSEWAAGAPDAVFLPQAGEEGIDSIDVSKTPLCRSFDDTRQWLGSLHSGEHNHKTVVIDSASTAEPLIHEAVCAYHKVDTIENVLGGWAKGFSEALKWWRVILSGLDALRDDRQMASVIIGHVKVKRFDDPIAGAYDQYQFDIHEKAAAMLYKWADVILFANIKTVVKGEDVGFNKEVKRGIDIAEGQRFLYTQRRPGHPGGGRGIYGRLPYEIPLSWDTFMSYVSASAAESNQ